MPRSNSFSRKKTIMWFVSTGFLKPACTSLISGKASNSSGTLKQFSPSLMRSHSPNNLNTEKYFPTVQCPPPHMLPTKPAFLLCRLLQPRSGEGENRAAVMTLPLLMWKLSKPSLVAASLLLAPFAQVPLTFRSRSLLCPTHTEQGSPKPPSPPAFPWGVPQQHPASCSFLPLSDPIPTHTFIHKRCTSHTFLAFFHPMSPTFISSSSSQATSHVDRRAREPILHFIYLYHSWSSCIYHLFLNLTYTSSVS